MWKTIALVVAALVAGLLGFAATRPDSFRVERSLLIQAPPERVYPLIADFHRWPAWSPWEKLDPEMTRTHAGAASGVGASYAWTGNGDVGAGRMEITEAVAPGRLAIQLDFFKPMESRNQTLFTLVPEAGGTRVNWLMQGPSPYLSKLMGVFVSMDRLVGSSFEEGLANLKAAAEQ